MAGLALSTRAVTSRDSPASTEERGAPMTMRARPPYAVVGCAVAGLRMNSEHTETLRSCNTVHNHQLLSVARVIGEGGAMSCALASMLAAHSATLPSHPASSAAADALRKFSW